MNLLHFIVKVLGSLMLTAMEMTTQIAANAPAVVDALYDVVETSATIAPTVISRPNIDVTKFDHRMPYRNMDSDAINKIMYDGSDTFSELLF